MQSLRDLIAKDSHPSRSLNTSQIRERWLYVCNFCGAWIDPKAVEAKDRTYYTRGQCQCPGAIEAREKDAERRQVEQDQERRRQLGAHKERYALKGALAAQTFETFDRSVQSEAYDVALSFFENPQSIVFAGKTNGLGKTHLMAAIANRCIEQGRSVKFGTLAEFLAQIRATYNDQAEMTTDRYVEQLTHSYLLCIDDLGKERLTEWGREQLFLIINARYNLRPEGHVILTSNTEGPGLAASMGIHNWSRMQEIGIVVYMKGSDYRLRGKK